MKSMILIFNVLMKSGVRFVWLKHLILFISCADGLFANPIMFVMMECLEYGYSRAAQNAIKFAHMYKGMCVWLNK